MFTLTSEHTLVPVVFRDTTLFLVEHNNEPFVPMKPVVSGMGMDWMGQFNKLKNTPRFCIEEISIQMPGDDQVRKTICLPLRKLPGWLMSIHPNKVDASIRPKVIAYQNECDDVLWQHWSRKHSPAPPPSLPAPEPTALKLPLRFEGWSRDGVTISEFRYLADDAVVLSGAALNKIRAHSGDEIVKRIADIEIGYIPAIIGAAMQRLTALTTPLIPQPA